jgi:hypothetical protein
MNPAYMTRQVDELKQEINVPCQQASQPPRYPSANRNAFEGEEMDPTTRAKSD